MNRRITIRVDLSTRQMVEQLVQDGKFESISDAIRVALRKLLKEGSDENATK